MPFHNTISYADSTCPSFTIANLAPVDFRLYVIACLFQPLSAKRTFDRVTVAETIYCSWSQQFDKTFIAVGLQRS